MSQIKIGKCVINAEEKMLDIACEYLADTDIVMIKEHNVLRKLNKDEWKNYIYRELWERL